MSTQSLPVSIRAYTEPTGQRKSKGKRKRVKHASKATQNAQDNRWADSVLVFDTETTADEVQRLLFGSYRYCRWDEDHRLVCVEQGIFYADDLPETDPAAFKVLKGYVDNHEADVAPGRPRAIKFVSRRKFVNDRLWRALRAGAIIVGFNLPFDLSRIAFDCGDARGRYYGGFSFALWDYLDRKAGQWQENPHRPRVCVRLLDSKRAFIGLTSYKRQPEEERQDPAIGRGRFLDLRTLSFALTGKPLSLRRAAKLFKTEHRKEEIPEHGLIDLETIDYNLRDVLVTAELLEKLRTEYDRHPISLPPEQAYSPASLAKACYKAMGVTQPRLQFEKVGPKLLGIALTTYYGGRAEVRIRKTAVPVVYCDFLSMYPTVNALMRLWDLMIAERLDVVDATSEVTALLNDVTVDGCFDPAFWPRLRFFALVEPDGDILPLRAQYDQASQVPSIGLNMVTADGGLWVAGPDLVGSVLLTGKVPQVLKAIKLQPVGQQDGLTPIELRGIEIDPRCDDFGARAIEIRKSLHKFPDLLEEDQEWLGRSLKILANSGGYGVLAEMNPQELPRDKPRQVTVYGMDEPFTCKTPAPEIVGDYCFPPLAALTTSAARLMLTLLEKCVTDVGGFYGFCDTDSMAIVASESGGLIQCEGGPLTLSDGTPAIRVLNWDDVDAIVQRFRKLNPYNREAISGSILKNRGRELSR